MTEVAFQGLHAELTDKILKVFFDVLNELGFGFLESVYHQAMLIALCDAGLQAREQVPLPVFFRSEKVGTFYADIVVNNLVILELKVTEQITKSHESQLVHYLRSTPLEVGLVLAFGERGRFKRIVLTNNLKRGREAPLHHP